jgi:hypothetical protein
LDRRKREAGPNLASLPFSVIEFSMTLAKSPVFDSFLSFYKIDLVLNTFSGADSLILVPSFWCYFHLFWAPI